MIMKIKIKSKMSNDIPFEIQVEIFKRLPLKTLIQYRSVSKPWKSLIESSHFIASYGFQHTQMHHLLVTYVNKSDSKYVSIVDDDTFPLQKVFLTVPLVVNMLKSSIIIGRSHGLFCFCGLSTISRTYIAVLWNPTIRKAVPVAVPDVKAYCLHKVVLGFGVCNETNDPKIVKLNHINGEVEVFTLSTRVWRPPYNNLNLPSKSIKFGWQQVVVDRFLYWLADNHMATRGSYTFIISFDIKKEEFGEINLPESVALQFDCFKTCMSKLRESLVVLSPNFDDNNEIFDLWMMEDGVLKSFTKLFTFSVDARVTSFRGLRKSGEPIIEIHDVEVPDNYKLFVYEPNSKQIHTLGIDRLKDPYFVYPYMETLLLLDQPNFTAFTEEETLKYLDDLAS